MVNNIAAIVLDAQAANYYYIVRTEGKPVVLGAAFKEALQRFPKPLFSMTHSLKLIASAKGLEACGQFEFLRDSHCGLMRGCLFCPPLPGGKLCELLVEDRVRECLGGTVATFGG